MQSQLDLNQAPNPDALFDMLQEDERLEDVKHLVEKHQEIREDREEINPFNYLTE